MREGAVTEALARVVAELAVLPPRAQDKIASLLREETDRQWAALPESPPLVRLLDRTAGRAFDDLRDEGTGSSSPEFPGHRSVLGSLLSRGRAA